MTFDRSRITMLAIAVTCLAGAVGVRLHDLQVTRCAELRERADQQSRRPISAEARRGAIVDRHGAPLAVSLATHQLYAHPPRVDDPATLAAELAPLIGVDRAKLRAQLSGDASFVFLDRFCEPEVVDRLRRAQFDLSGESALGVLPSTRRFYPHGRLAAHVIGAVGVDGEGRGGVELSWDDSLRGDPTKYLFLEDARGGRLRELVRPPRQVAHDLVLTIDSVLQHVLERELDLAMSETGARSASAILIDPETGDVLALANRPTIDLNAYRQGTASMWRNRALVDQYEPGSTFKIVSMAAALDSGVVRPEDRFDCENGRFRTRGRVVRDSSPHGVLDAQSIFAKSSNIGMVKIGARIDDRLLHETITRFGFGRPSGVRLPGEADGVVHPVARWNSNSSKASIAFGHEITVNAMQMVVAAATVANDGVRVAPRVVSSLRTPDGSLLPRAVARGERVISESTARRLARMMELVVSDGTGRRAAVDGWELAGKTGTAQKVRADGGYSETDYIASFVGYGPARSPRLAGIVVLDAPEGQRHQGGVVAAPVFRRIMTDALRHLRVPPDDPARVVSPIIVQAGSGAAHAVTTREQTAGLRRGRVPELRGESLRSAVALLTAAGLRWQVSGRGVVADQVPPAGTALAPGSICRIALQPAGTTGERTALASWRGQR